MKTNTSRRSNPIRTHEGAVAKRINPELQLRRSVMSCMLWEKEFYEDGQSIADRIMEFADKVDRDTLAEIAIEAREDRNLRHVPLLLLCALVKKGGSAKVSETIERVIQRADELSELLAIYWRDGRKPLAAQLKKGLAAAFCKFDEYKLAKYNRDSTVKLRDVLFLCHAKPRDKEQEALWKRLVDDELKTPDTWEVGLSTGGDKKETFTRLLEEGKLGYMALLRNLRNMQEAGVDDKLIKQSILARKGAERVLPFRYTAAARHAPSLEPELDHAMCEAIAELPSLTGHTIVLVDVSDSMADKLSGKSDLTRMDAAATLASMVSAQTLRVYTFSYKLVEVPPRRGMAGVDAIIRSQEHGGTNLREALEQINKVPHDRLIVITDEQVNGGPYSGHGRVPDPVCENAYMINVASARNGVGYGKWCHIDGFSESVLGYIHEAERSACE